MCQLHDSSIEQPCLYVPGQISQHGRYVSPFDKRNHNAKLGDQLCQLNQSLSELYASTLSVGYKLSIERGRKEAV